MGQVHGAHEDVDDAVRQGGVLCDPAARGVHLVRLFLIPSHEGGREGGRHFVVMDGRMGTPSFPCMRGGKMACRIGVTHSFAIPCWNVQCGAVTCVEGLVICFLSHHTVEGLTTIEQQRG